MGREIRRVPPDWVHPTYTADELPYGNRKLGDMKRLYDQDYESAALEWIRNFDLWRQGLHEAQQGQWACKDKYYWEYDGHPDPDSYRERQWTEAEATAYQVYETVSEGTPVTPVFLTQEALIEHLVKFGDAWDERRGSGGWSRKAAESFVKAGSAPSMIVTNDASGVRINEPRDGIPE